MPLWTSMPSKVPLGCPNPIIPLMSPTIPHAPSDMYELPRQFLINLMISHFPWMTNIPGNGGFHRNPSISHTAHHESSNKWVQVPVTAFKSSTRSTCGQQHRSKNNESDFPCQNDWFHFLAFPCIPRWLVPVPRISTYDWLHFLNFPVWLTTSRWWWFLCPGHHCRMVSPSRLAAARWCGSSALTVTAEWRLHPDWQHPGDVVPPLWLSQLNGLPTQTGNAQVMWFLRPDRHSWMASPPRLAAPRWCGSSALTIIAEWSPHPDW